MQEDESEFDSSMTDDPGTPEYITDVDEKKVNVLSTMKIEGKKNDKFYLLWILIESMKDPNNSLIFAFYCLFHSLCT